MRGKVLSLVWTLVFFGGTFSAVYGVSSYLTSFKNTYGNPATISVCSLCHPGGDTGRLNGYGDDFLNAGNNFEAIEPLDSDGDGFTNIAEINARTFPGDPASHPVAADTTPPDVTFIVPSAATSLTVSITTFIATDATGVTGYMVTETSTPPSTAATGWTATPCADYTFSTAGSKSLFAWAKDGAGNVSAPVSAPVTITLPDTTPPDVTFIVPSVATSLTVSITTFIATDATGVTGYMVTETSTPPSAAATGWTATPCADYTFSTAGSKSLFAWAKDGAGNVSAPVSAPVTITLPDVSVVIHLSPGWNFISFPRQPPDPAIAQVLKDISSNLAVVWTYNGTNQSWLKFKPSSDTSMNTLTTVEPSKGYWLYMTDSGTVDITSWLNPSTTVVHLSFGWNLTGYIGANNKDITQGLGAGVDGKWVVIWTWEQGQWYAKHSTVTLLPVQLLTALYQGKAYWIRTNQAVDWTQ